VFLLPPTEKELLTMVRDVSEDQIYDTIEFNEFLQMMSKQQRFGMTEDSLKDAFRIFDKDDDGFISVEELRHIMQSLGEKMTDKELEEMVGEADEDKDGLINYEGA
jgi:Ca2+-binding EF-hand superfamily protein